MQRQSTLLSHFTMLDALREETGCPGWKNLPLPLYLCLSPCMHTLPLIYITTVLLIGFTNGRCIDEEPRKRSVECKVGWMIICAVQTMKRITFWLDLNANQCKGKGTLLVTSYSDMCSLH